MASHYLTTLRNYFSTADGKYVKEKILQFGGTVSGSLFIVAVTLFVRRYMDIDPFLLLSIPVILSGWFGTTRIGLVALAVCTTGYVYFFLPSFQLPFQQYIGTAVNVALFMWVNYLVIFLLNKAKRTDEVSEYKKRHNIFLDLIRDEKERNQLAKAEIKARDEFLSIASHELKTPLTLSLLQIQRALHNIRNVSLANFSVQKLMDMLESVEQQTDRLSKMISDLSNVSLITTGRMKLEPTEIDLAVIVKEAVEHVKISMRKPDHPITTDIKGSCVGIYDKVRIEQVITNLLTNAIKYGDNKPIDVKIEKKSDRYNIIVQDRGLGIPKNMQSKIFGRFERGNGHGNIKGLGVGLYITHQIIAAHEGKIHLKSKPGKGSTFIVELPVKPVK
ncbi:HAMP domain-containing histidine kinase [Candidatus Roizmanbacteria bacterium]|nr:MAG: HAMP domain-containing histidine kinase [Candidatus Roizmanbacteria bacterium]